MHLLRRIAGIALGAVAIALPAIAGAQQGPAAQAATPPVIGAPAPAAAANDRGDENAEYILGPEDVVEFEIVGTPDRTRARIYADGTIQTALAGRISAAGRTPRQLASEIAKVLKDGGFYADPVVNVEIVGYASRYVTVLGAVASPGLVPINRPYRLSEIVARVGGVRADAADYIIVRPENGPEKRYLISELARGDDSKDPMVLAGEKIFAPEADLFYISGQVRSPGSYPLKTGMTVAQAIAAGGGLTESGSDKKVKVRRANKSIKLKADELVQAGDVLTVGERLF